MVGMLCLLAPRSAYDHGGFVLGFRYVFAIFHHDTGAR